MRRLTAVLVAALIALAPVVADARVAVVMDGGGNARSNHNTLTAITGILDRFGVEFDVVPASMAKTEFCRTGQFNTAHPGVFSQAVKTYVAVMHLNCFYTVFTDAIPGYNPDSLTLTAALPLVPQIFVGRNESAGGTYNTFQTASTESSGVQFAGEVYDGFNPHAVGYSAYLVGSTYRWKYDGYAKMVVDTGTVYSNPPTNTIYADRVVPGGFRPLVAASMTPAYDRVCHDCDSIYTEITGSGGSVSRVSTPDTLLLWVRQNKHVKPGESVGANSYPTGPAHNVFVQPAGTSAGLDPSLIVMALAYVDSLTRGAIFTSSTKIPAQAAIHIDDGWRRTGQQNVSGGIAWSDTATLKQTVDSLASLRVPFVVGVGVDSLWEFSNQDSTWWERAKPYVHYTPHVHGGTGAIDGHLNNIYDMYSGNYAMYRGEDCGNSSGSTPVTASIYCLARLGFWHLEQRFPGRVDHIIMPPFDDWTPSTVLKANAGPGVDSLVWTWFRAGSRGTRTHGSGPTSTIMGEIGYETNARTYSVRRNVGRGSTTASWTDTSGKTPAAGFGSQEMGRFRLLLTSGYMSAGSSDWSGWSLPLSNFLGGFYQTRYDPTWDSADYQSGFSTVTACHVTDLGAGPNINVPTRPAWWQIKWIVNRFYAVNRLAGRNINEITYPENIR